MPSKDLTWEEETGVKNYNPSGHNHVEFAFSDEDDDVGGTQSDDIGGMTDQSDDDDSNLQHQHHKRGSRHEDWRSEFKAVIHGKGRGGLYKSSSQKLKKPITGPSSSTSSKRKRHQGSHSRPRPNDSTEEDEYEDVDTQKESKRRQRSQPGGGDSSYKRRRSASGTSRSTIGHVQVEKRVTMQHHHHHHHTSVPVISPAVVVPGAKVRLGATPVASSNRKRIRFRSSEQTLQPDDQEAENGVGPGMNPTPRWFDIGNSGEGDTRDDNAPTVTDGEDGSDNPEENISEEEGQDEEEEGGSQDESDDGTSGEPRVRLNNAQRRQQFEAQLASLESDDADLKPKRRAIPLYEDEDWPDKSPADKICFLCDYRPNPVLAATDHYKNLARVFDNEHGLSTKRLADLALLNFKQNVQRFNPEVPDWTLRGIKHHIEVCGCTSRGAKYDRMSQDMSQMFERAKNGNVIFQDDGYEGPHVDSRGVQLCIKIAKCIMTLDKAAR